MAKKIQKNKKGPNSKFISRAKAIKKLQIPLKDFRKLCILKGVHPREPKKKLGKTHLTYYHEKDIKYLEKDKTIDYFRNLQIFRKKLKKAIVKRDKTKVKSLKENKPQLDLNHIVKERYFEFDDALKDLDDALSTIALIAKFPAHRLFKIDPVKLKINQSLLLMFKSFVMYEKLLEKVFLSFKGIYYQARIQGQLVIWLEPYPFSTRLPYDVDYKVILSFSEFYSVFLKFVIFKLFKDHSLVYPPKINQSKDLEELTESSQNQLLNCVIQQNKNQEEDIIETEELKKLKNQNKTNKNLFQGLKFFLSREINKEIFEFCIKSFGGEVFYHLDNFNSEFYKSNSFTHVIIDREVQQKDRKQNLEYVQPQWICDSINNQIILPIQDYQPGLKLPPHLSPFVNHKKEGFIPQRLQEIQKFKGEFIEESVNESFEEENQEKKIKEKYEAKKNVYDYEEETKNQQNQKLQKQKEEKNLSAMMLTKKKKKLLDRIKNLNTEKKEKVIQLIKRRKELSRKQLINQQCNLIICPTPLGNLKDLSIRAFEALQEAEVIICEDTRQTGKLFKMLRLKNFSENLDDLTEDKKEENQIDDLIFDKYKEKEEREHKNLSSIKRVKNKIRDFHQINDVEETKQLAKEKLKETDSLGFLLKYNKDSKEETSYQYGDEYNYDTSSKNRTKTGAKIVYGLESEYINFIKERAYESKLKNKRGLLISANRFNEEEKILEILKLLKAGLKICLVSDAGSPCLSDPGYKLINAAIKQNVLIHSLPGPNAITLSLVSSGFPADNFLFLGYLEKKEQLKINALQEERDKGITIVFFENKNRIMKTLIQIEKVFGKKQLIYMGVEMTKLHERHLRGTVENVYETLNKNPDYTIPSLKGEITVVLAPFSKEFNSEMNQNQLEQKQKEKEEKYVKVEVETVAKQLHEFMDIDSKNLQELLVKILKISKNRAYKLIHNLKQKNSWDNQIFGFINGQIKKWKRIRKII